MTTVALARIARPHGVRGELKVIPFNAGSDALLRLHEVRLRLADGREIRARVEQARPADKSVLLKLAGVDSREAADELRGAEIVVAREALPEPGEGEYYLVDLLGAEVFVPEGRIGVVVEIQTHPSVDAIVILRADGTRVVQVLTQPWLGEVAPEQRRIVLTSSDGLLE